jgi:hypothetical protein
VYIYKWCYAGKKYSKNLIEVEAEEAAKKLLPLLNIEICFFCFWQWDLLRYNLGYLVEILYHNIGKDL